MHYLSTEAMAGILRRRIRLGSRNVRIALPAGRGHVRYVSGRSGDSGEGNGVPVKGTSCGRCG
jgi:hypothetical protein